MMNKTIINISYVFISCLSVNLGCAYQGYNENDIYCNSWLFRNYNEIRKTDGGLMLHQEYFLDKLKQSGALRHGLKKQEVESLLGKPNIGAGDGQVWMYAMGYSSIDIVFIDGLTSKYTWHFEEGGPGDLIW